MTVITLVQPINAASCRNRKVALNAISRQLEKLKNYAAGRDNLMPGGQVIEGKFLSVSWFPMPDVHYVHVQIRLNHSLVMSGRIYPGGIMDVMSWKRGFEHFLFRDFGEVVH